MTLTLVELIERLVATGVKVCCMGAGSRSTQLVSVLNSLNIQMIPFFDERAVGYLALGIAKATQQPVMIVTTSGTAVSNLCPAMTEAVNSHIPIIALTADRPSHLQGTSANQTIQQQGIFHDAAAAAHWESDQIDQDAFENVIQAIQLQSGPVHINAHLEDPVNETPLKSNRGNAVKPPSTVQRRTLTDTIPAALSSAKKGVLCIGQLEPWVDHQMVRQLIDHIKWPVVIDGTNGALKNHPLAMASVDAFCLTHSPSSFDCVLYIGGHWVSKRMVEFLTAAKAVHVSEGARPVVPMASNQLPYASLNQGAFNSYTLDSSGINIKTADSIESVIKRYPTSDLAFIYAALHQIEQPFDCFVSNSLPIRFFDQMNPQQLRQLHVNRGASGIDGNIATIIGLCMVPSDTPLLAIVGDLASLYDLNSFFMLNQCQRPVTILIVNNNGGDILSLLPSAKSAPKFDEQFKLAHQSTLTPVLKGMGLDAAQITDPSQLNITFLTPVIECQSSGGASAFKELMSRLS